MNGPLLVFFQLFHDIFYKLSSLTEWGSFFKLFSTWNVNIQINEAHNISEHICSTVNWNTVKHEHYLSCFISTEKVQSRILPKPFWSCSVSLNRGATSAARAPKPDKPPNMAARHRCFRRVLFCKIKVRSWSCRSYSLWRPC